MNRDNEGHLRYRFFRLTSVLVVLTFTLNEAATGLRVILESSLDLNNWSQAAVIEDGALVTDDGTISVNTDAPTQAPDSVISNMT